MSDSIAHRAMHDVPEQVARVAELMTTFEPGWALCGGWAVDAWLGRESRLHADVDLSVFADDQRALFGHFADWQLVAHVEGDYHSPWDGRHLELPNHVMARIDTGEPLADRVDSTQEEGFSLDVQLGERSGDEWVLCREPRISVPLNDAVQQSPWGLPTVVPEILIFFKASELRRRDRIDFMSLLSHLSEGQRVWLRDTVSLIPHPWLAELSA